MLDILSLISLLFIIAILRRIVNVLPSVFMCAVRWKENINLDSIVKLSRDRDLTAAVLTIPFLLIVCRFNLLSFRFTEGMTPEARFCTTAAVFAAYLLFRIFASQVFISRKSRRAFRDKDNSDRTFFIILAITLLACSPILSALNIGTNAARHTMFWLSAAIYSLFLIRKFQIFQSYHPNFAAFLYLCALEIIPTGTLVVSAIIF